MDDTLCNMDGTKRKAELISASTPEKTSYLGFNPGSKGTLPSVAYPESAIRSTQSSSNDKVVDTKIQPRSASIPNVHRSDAALDVSAQSAALSLVTEMPWDANAEEEVEVRVDTDNGGDQVYMYNVHPDSWSGSLASEDDPMERAKIPPQFHLALQDLKRRQERTWKEQQTKAMEVANEIMEARLNGPDSSYKAPMEDVSWKSDLLLRNVIWQIKKNILQGVMVTVERLRASQLTTTCSHPYCPMLEKIIPFGAYYLRLSKGYHPHVYYCLPCLEALWDCQELSGGSHDQLKEAHTGLDEHTSAAASQDQGYPPPALHLDGMLDLPVTETVKTNCGSHGRIQHCLWTSKHATHSTVPMEEKMEDSAGDSTPSLSDDSEDSERSLSLPQSPSSGAERLPFTPFQSLARYISAGESLSEQEKAALEMWKATSVEQLQSDTIVRKSEQSKIAFTEPATRQEGSVQVLHTQMEEGYRDEEGRAEQGYDVEGNGTRANSDEWQQTERAVERRSCAGGQPEAEPNGQVRISKRDCYGKNLSAVLASVAG